MDKKGRKRSCLLAELYKKVLSPKNHPRSLVLRYACKALSKPSAYNQVLFHKTCAYVFLHKNFYQFVNKQIIFVLFCDDIVNLRDFSALGFSTKRYGQIFS